MTEAPTLAIREVAAMTGVPAPTLRMWETRHGFPVPARVPSGHRRYSHADCESIARVLAERQRGLSLGAAIERVTSAPTAGVTSFFAVLRDAQPALAPQVLRKRALVELSHAIEDEICARADGLLVIGAFQRARFYRESERRWRELARTAELAIALADFDHRRVRKRGVCELPLPPGAPLGREWSLISDGERLSVALTAWEITSGDDVSDADRRFETIWTVEPTAVRRVAAHAAEVIARSAPKLIRQSAGRLERRPAPPAPDLSDVMSLVNRCTAYLAAL